MNETQVRGTLNDWEACDGGELQQVVWQVKNRRRTQSMIRIASGVAGVLLFALLVSWGWQQMTTGSNGLPGSLSCAETATHLPRLAAGEITDASLVERLNTHLSDCPHCQQKFEQLRQSSSALTEPKAVAGQATTSCPCEMCRSHDEPVRDTNVFVATAK